MEVDMGLDNRRDEPVAVVVAFVPIHWEVCVAVRSESLDQEWPLQVLLSKLVVRSDIYKAWRKLQGGTLGVENVVK